MQTRDAMGRFTNIVDGVYLTKNYYVRLPMDEYRRLQELAKSSRTTVAALVRRAVGFLPHSLPVTPATPTDAVGGR